MPIYKVAFPPFSLPFLAIIFTFIFKWSFDHFHFSFLKKYILPGVYIFFFHDFWGLKFWNGFIFLSHFFSGFASLSLTNCVVLLCLPWFCIILCMKSYFIETFVSLNVLYLWFIFGYNFHLLHGNISMNFLHQLFVFHALFLCFFFLN